jgi:hypothetical protein
LAWIRVDDNGTDYYCLLEKESNNNNKLIPLQSNWSTKQHRSNSNALSHNAHNTQHTHKPKRTQTHTHTQTHAHSTSQTFEWGEVGSVRYGESVSPVRTAYLPGVTGAPEGADVATQKRVQNHSLAGPPVSRTFCVSEACVKKTEHQQKRNTTHSFASVF